jgi:hypothetical protein
MNGAAKSEHAAPEKKSAPTHEEIANLAYSFWEARRRPAGSSWEDWFRAEKELGQPL